jgi:hypothetical protein
MATLLIFIALQFCDAATTLVFLRHGVAEANPLIRYAIGQSASPILALAGIKSAGCGLAWIAWRTRRHRLMARVNILFALCVAWNLIAICRSA